MKIVSAILARGGSKGIPRKNLKELNGKPLIYYAIKASLDSKVNETWVSTDDDEIALVSRGLGAQVIKRPAELAGDKSPSEDALLHFAQNVDFDYLVFIQPTSPLLESKYIDKGIEMMLSGKYDSVFGAYEEHWMGKWNLDENNVAVPKGWDIYHRPRRQDIGKIYAENGAFYITKKESLLKSRLRYSGRIGIVEMPFSKSFQIDTIEDLNFLEKFFIIR